MLALHRNILFQSLEKKGGSAGGRGVILQGDFFCLVAIKVISVALEHLLGFLRPSYTTG